MRAPRCRTSASPSPRGSAFGFLGHNGAGKTTMIRMLLDLTRADAGEMRISGRPVPHERAAVLARVGAMMEEPNFHRHLTGRENLRVIAAARGPAAARRIDGALRRVGLSDRAGERVKTTRRGCDSAWASPAACSPTRSFSSWMSR